MKGTGNKTYHSLVTQRINRDKKCLYILLRYREIFTMAFYFLVQEEGILSLGKYRTLRHLLFRHSHIKSGCTQNIL